VTRVAAATVITLALIAAPAPAKASADQGDIEAMICAYDWPCYQALAVAHCEDTELDPGVVNWYGPYVGVFQVGLMHGLSVEELQDPAANIGEAYSLWQSQGWRPWPYCGFARFGY
jgi:hypothetical protein